MRFLLRLASTLLSMLLLHATSPRLIEVASGQQPAPRLGLNDVVMTVSLVSPISTKTSKEGDQIVARVLTPEPYQAAVLEGKVQKIKKAKKGDKAEVLFSFRSLTWSGVTYPIRAELTDVTNSKGVQNVDEEGRAIGKSSNKRRILATLIGAGVGAAAGAAVAGARGAAVGAGTGAIAGLLIGIKFTARGPDMEFAPGSQFTLKVSDRVTQ